MPAISRAKAEMADLIFSRLVSRIDSMTNSVIQVVVLYLDDPKNFGDG